MRAASQTGLGQGSTRRRRSFAGPAWLPREEARRGLRLPAAGPRL